MLHFSWILLNDSHSKIEIVNLTYGLKKKIWSCKTLTHTFTKTIEDKTNNNITIIIIIIIMIIIVNNNNNNKYNNNNNNNNKINKHHSTKSGH